MKSHNILSEVKTLADHNVLLDAEDVVERYKPEDMFILDTSWERATLETRALLLEVNRLEKSLEHAYWQAVKIREFEEALYCYQQRFTSPTLDSIDRILYDKGECVKRERDFTTNAREWIGEAQYLLRQARF